MTAATIVQPEPSPIKRLISLEKFLEKYSNREDPFKYEWNKGIVEKKERTMNRNQFAIYRKLLKLFCKTAFQDVKICFGDNICTAVPVMSDFNISVNDIFG